MLRLASSPLLKLESSVRTKKIKNDSLFFVTPKRLMASFFSLVFQRCASQDGPEITRLWWTAFKLILSQ